MKSLVFGWLGGTCTGAWCGQHTKGSHWKHHWKPLYTLSGQHSTLDPKDSSVKYVCSSCYVSLKNSKTLLTDSIHLSKLVEQDFTCTCCHKIFEDRKKVVLFQTKKYNLSSEPAKTVLKKEFQCKIEYFEELENCGYS